MSVDIHVIESRYVDRDQVLIIGQHKSREAAVAKARKSRKPAFVVHEPETWLTIERWLVAVGR